MVSRKENKVKRIVLLFISIWIAFAAYGEDNHKKERHPDDRKINVGIRGGFNSSMFLVSDYALEHEKAFYTTGNLVQYQQVRDFFR